MTSALPHQRPVGKETHPGAPRPSFAGGSQIRFPASEIRKALEELAALAARLCGTPWASIRAGEGAGCLDIAPAGTESIGNPPFSIGAPALDHEGSVLGRILAWDRAPREFSEDQKQTLAALGRQAGALLALDRNSSHPDREEGAASDSSSRATAEIAPHFKTFLDHMPCTAYIKDENHRYLFANRILWKRYNGTGEEGDPRELDQTSRLAPESVEKIRQHDRLVLATGKAQETIEKLTYDGREHSWWSCKFPISDSQGRRLVGGISLDLSELDQARAESLLFDNIFKNIDVGMLIWRLEDRDDLGSFRLLASNAAASRMMGIPAEEMLGKPIRETFPIVIKMGIAEIYRRVIESGRSEDLGEIPYGDDRIEASHFTTKVFPLPDRTVGVAFENVTEKRRIRQRMSESVERFELLSRATNDALWELNPQTGAVWWNERVYDMLGYLPGAVTPGFEAFAERIHPEDRERVLAEIRKSAGGGKDHFTREYRIISTDGSLKHIYARGYVTRDGGNAPVRVLGAMMDVSDLKRAEQGMRENEERYRRLVELLPDVVAISIDGILEFVNRAGLAFRGVTRPDEMVGRHILDFFHPDDRPKVAERQRQLAAGESVPPLPFRFLRADGSILEAESRAIPFPYRGRNANLVVIRDVTERKQAEEVLRRSEEHYRLLFEENAQPMYLFDLGTLRFLDVNRAAEIQYGYSREEFLAMNLRDIRPEEDVPFLEEKVRNLRMGGGNMGIWRHRRKDGSLLQAEIISHILKSSGSPSAIVLVNDVTEKLQAIEKLRHSEERYRTLARVSPVGLFRTDRAGTCVYVNEHCTLITGQGADQLERQGWIAFLHPEDRERIGAEWDRTLSLGAPFHAEYRFMKPGGMITWVLGRALADKGPDGSLIGYVGTLTDITERKQAETLLAGQKRTLAMVASGWALVDVLNSLLHYVEKESSGMAGGILMLEPESRRLAWASAPSLPEGLRRALDQLPADSQGGPPGLAAAERRMTVCADISDTAGEAAWTLGRTEAVESGFRSCTAFPILGSYGGLLGAIVFFFKAAGQPAPFDVKLLETASDLAGIAVERWRQEETGRTNQELSEENRRILEANRMKSEFIASMSHELRTPLNAIIGFSQLLIDKKVGPLNDKQSEYLGDVLDGGMHLLRLINDVLDLAKIESGKMQLYPETVPVPKAIREVCDILMPMALAKGIHFKIAADLSPETAMLDSQKFKQVLYNLSSNAIKFSGQGGVVRITAERDEVGALKVKVIDHGIGIRKEDMGKLFQEFQQLDSGSAKQFPGTGLGLVITKKLVELHRGTVGVESEPGSGSTFYAVFPEIPAAGDA